MKIENNKFVTIACELRENNKEGAVLDVYTKEEPLSIVMGTENQMEAFENSILGLEKGSAFDFILESKDAFGERQDKLMVKVPMNSIIKDEDKESEVTVGQLIKVVDDDEEQEQIGEVVQIIEETQEIVIDFNHPYAGMTIHFGGEIIDVRDYL
jgi:FKBP-type peptidyl-prolyl cis-trans isomerase SlyD